MVRIAILPIVMIAVVSIVVILGLVLAAVVKSPNRKFLLLIPAGAAALVVLAVGVLFALRPQMTESLAVAEQYHLNRAQAEIREAREEYQVAFQSQVLDYRGDSTQPLVIDPVATGDADGIQIFRYSPTGQTADEPLSQPPAWVDELSSPNPNLANQSFVLSSEPWSSVDEADDELYALLSVHLGEFLSAFEEKAEGWQPSRTSLESMPLIQDAVRETVPLEIGEHTVHVQHAYWKVELTPQIRDALHSQWQPVHNAAIAQQRAALVQERLVYLGSGLGILTLLFAMAAGLFRLRRPPRGSVRQTTAAVLAIIFLLAGLSTLFLA